MELNAQVADMISPNVSSASMDSTVFPQIQSLQEKNNSPKCYFMHYKYLPLLLSPLEVFIGVIITAFSDVTVTNLAI